MRLTELAELAGMTKQSAARWSTTWSSCGYVERIPDPEDRRAKLIRLTERGKEAQRVGFALFAELEERWAERFGAERIEAPARDARGDRRAARPPRPSRS